MKRRTRKLFINIFIKSLFIVALLLTAGILSYKAVMLYWQPKEDATVAYQENNESESIEAVGSDHISKNLIYSYNQENKELESIVLEIMNCDSNELTYLTVPVKSQLTMSPAMYQKMILVNPEIPQLLKLSAMTKYIDFNKSAEDGVRIVEDMLGININYYTEIPAERFDEMFTGKDVKQEDGNDLVTKEVFTSDYKSTIKSLDSEDSIKSYIEENYSDVVSDLPLEDKLSLAANYANVNIDDIRFDLLKGTNTNSAYLIDTALVQEQLSELSIN